MPLLSFPYNGSPFLIKSPDFPESGQYSVAVDNEEFVSDINSRVLQTMGGLENEERTHTFSFNNRVDLDEFITFLKTDVRGKWGRFWMPSWADDFIVLGGDLFGFTAKLSGYTQYVWPALTHRHILAVKNSNMTPGTIWGRYIGAPPVDNGDGTETFSATLDFPYDLSFSNLPTAQGHRHMYIHLCRLVSDSVEIKYYGREDAEISLAVVTIPEEGP